MYSSRHPTYPVSYEEYLLRTYCVNLYFYHRFDVAALQLRSFLERQTWQVPINESFNYKDRQFPQHYRHDAATGLTLPACITYPSLQLSSL